MSATNSAGTTGRTPAPHTSTAPSTPSFAQSSWLVAEREVRMKLRSKAFLISTGILMVVVLGSILLGGFLGGNTESTTVAVTSDTAAAVQGQTGIEATEVATAEEAEQLVRDGDVTAAILPDDSTPLGIVVVADSETPSGLLQQLSITPPVTLLDGDAQNPFLAYLVAIAFGVVFFASAMTFGSTIAQSVVEEKQTRVVEILMSAVPVQALLAGKVVGNSILAFGQIAMIAALAIIGLTITGQSDLLSLLGAPVLWFVVFFVLGFVLLAALFAATGSMVSRVEDIGSTTTPVTMLVMIPYFLVIFFYDNPVVLGIMSYVPFSAPVGMPVRLFLGDAQWWEPLLSLVILAITALGTIVLGSKIYENSLLKLGGTVKWRDALSR
ncbi:ABC transporter permease [Labedella endophytica]|uniref:ABC transporter permease n=1 Tax=Labedella endophytica TaxID=1523160 RepID=A0A3S0WZ26_9MICO|nr:ABC transporter permease [Labedella endophytica]RUR01613.1 ABC transporter permease [Labedella endophytica]